MNITLLIDRWEQRKSEMTCDDCIRELKMMASGELREPHRLDSLCHFKKWKGSKWKDVIEQDPGYVNWLYENVHGFMLDEAAHNYLIEMGG